MPATFICLMNSCIHDILDKLMPIYLDDILIYSGTKAEYKVYLCQVFDHLYKEILFVKCKKCKSGKDSVEYLGHIFGQGHVSMDPSKVQTIKKWLY